MNLWQYFSVCSYAAIKISPWTATISSGEEILVPVGPFKSIVGTGESDAIGQTYFYSCVCYWLEITHAVRLCNCVEKKEAAAAIKATRCCEYLAPTIRLIGFCFQQFKPSIVHIISSQRRCKITAVLTIRQLREHLSLITVYVCFS